MLVADSTRIHRTGEGEGKMLLEGMKDGELDGMQYFDGEIETMARTGISSYATGLLYATNHGNLQIRRAGLPAEEAKAVMVR